MFLMRPGQNEVTCKVSLVMFANLPPRFLMCHLLFLRKLYLQVTKYNVPLLKRWIPLGWNTVRNKYNKPLTFCFNLTK